MSARTSRVSLRYALRSVALTLFPTAFIALFTWATAGSTSGNTSDPMRATGWLWLATHQIPLVIHGVNGQGSGVLSFLPLLALIFPWWAIKRSFRSLLGEISQGYQAQLFFALWYAAISELIALASYSQHIHSNIYLAPIFTFLIALAASSKFSPSALKYLKFAGAISAVFLGLAMLVVTASLCLHWNIMKSIEIVITPGVIGGLLYTLVQLLYLPNIALASLSYLTGSGFTFGAHTNIAPTHFVLNGISAIPVLAALPTGKHPLFAYGIALWSVIFLTTTLLILRSVRGFRKQLGEASVSFFIYAALATGVGYLASGELLTPALNRVGVAWLRLAAVISISALAILAITLLFPQLIRWIVAKIKGEQTLTRGAQ